MDIRKQEYLLSILLSSRDVFSRCVSILKPDYFDGDVKLSVRFLLEYFEKYNTPPDKATVEAEYDIKIDTQNVTTDKIVYACEEIEKYCRESAVAAAMLESTNDLMEGNLGIIVERMREAVSVSLQKELGWSFFEKDFAKKLEEALSTQQTISTGIRGLDTHLSGGLSRQQVTNFTANSGVGKSIMLNNLAYNYSRMGYNVVLLSLELPKEMIFTRSAAITSGYDVKYLRDNKSNVVSVAEKVIQDTEGSLVMERIRGDACTNDVRSYLTHYELELNKRPDVIVIDYLDKMTPNQGIGKLSISEQDKHKSEQFAELVFDYNAIGLTASQQNREAIGNASPKQDVIAGGMTKINTVDNVISLYMDDQMRLRGEMVAYFLKTRSSDGVGKSSQLYFDSKSLRITDRDSASNHGLFDVSSRKVVDFAGGVEETLPGLTAAKVNESSLLIDFMEELENG